MRRFTAILLVLILGLSLSASVQAGPPEEEGVRILLPAGDAKAAGLPARHRFGSRVSAHVTRAQVESLQRRGIAYELVPRLEIPQEEPPFDAMVTKKGVARPVPGVQVPWGVKAVNGNPDLTASQVSGGAGLIVAVLDTGHADHPDFYRADGSPVIAQCTDFTSKKAAVVEGSCLDGLGHGTHVTGTVAAAGGVDGLGIFGVAPDASIYSFKVITDKGGGYADDIAMGIRTAADRGAHIITMSFGLGALSPLVQDATLYASGRGVLLIAAAGNAGPAPESIAYPAALPEVVAVAGLNADESVMTMSSRGLSDGDDQTISLGEIELSAPGAGVISTAYTGGYVMKSGTSMAAPHIAGLAAKMWQGSAARTRAWLVSQAKQHDVAAAGFDTASGYGMPQVRSLSQSLWTD